MVPSIMHQILHNPKLAKLDLSSLASAGSGAAYLPDDLRLAFKRRATKLSLLAEGSDFPCHHRLVLITTLQVMECLNVYAHIADCLSINGTKRIHLRPLLFFFSLFRACSGDASTQYGA
jgi:hypothetical protein